MANVKQVTSETFEEEVIKSSLPVLVDFNATWCGPCKMLGPTIEKVSGEYEGKAKVVALDIDENGDVAAKYGVMSIPTLIVFKGGEEVNRSVGLIPEPKVKALIDEAL
ncbi:MAG: thioredoxin [Abditibacteriota bacterium]|nr:thioredoxin [Abditibacteriota bacterium]